MLQNIISGDYSSLLALGGILFAFLATVTATAKLCQYLPKDAGREFAHDGKLSAGKPRGAGIIFVLAFVASALLFVPMKAELVIYLILTVICMVTGFLDDASEKPWGEWKKGLLDLCVAILVAMTFLHYNDNTSGRAFGDADHHYHHDDLSGGQDPGNRAGFLLSDTALCGLYPGISVVQRHAQPSADG